MKDLEGSSIWFNRVLTDSKNLHVKISNYIFRIVNIPSLIKNYKEGSSGPFDINFRLASVAGVKTACFLRIQKKID